MMILVLSIVYIGKKKPEMIYEEVVESTTDEEFIN